MLQHSKSHRVPGLQSAQAEVTLGLHATEGATASARTHAGRQLLSQG